MRCGSAERVTSSPWAGKIERAFAATWVEFSLVTFFWRDKRKLLANGEKVVHLMSNCGHAHRHFDAAEISVVRSMQLFNTFRQESRGLIFY